jgi:hypothetical protein
MDDSGRQPLFLAAVRIRLDASGISLPAIIEHTRALLSEDTAAQSLFNLYSRRIPAKIIALRSQDSITEEALIENLALSTYCPDGIGRWFYERAAGSYNTMLLREGTTPARLRQLKESIPTSRRITKTDLAKYLNAWDQRPGSVSFGTQKNFERFMADLTNTEADTPPPLPDVPAYKLMIAKAILFKRSHTLVRPMFQQAQANDVGF